MNKEKNMFLKVPLLTFIPSLLAMLLYIFSLYHFWLAFDNLFRISVF